MGAAWEQIDVDNSPMRIYLSVPSGATLLPAIVVIQHRDGLDEFTQAMTRRISDAGYIGAALDLYHRDVRVHRDDAATLRSRLSDSNVIADVTATVDFLKAHGSVDGKQLGIIGFCMGGRVAYLMACVSTSFKAAVSYYGGNMFESWGQGTTPFERTTKMVCPILAHFGDEDENPSLDDMRRLDAELSKLEKIHDFCSYPGVGHSFMNNRHKNYHPEADKTSWRRTLDFLSSYVRDPVALPSTDG